MKNIFNYIVLIAGVALCAVSCDKFLDTMPDNRTEIDSPTKVKALLVSAYPTRHYALFAELLSDDCDDNGAVVSNNSPGRYYEQIWNWQDITESANDSPDNVWTNNWGCIAAANQALEAIEELGGKDNPELSASYGEALICRASAHFTLVNLFCLTYNPATAATDQGIPYMEEPEKSLNPKYERGNVADVYAKIDRDVEEGLKYIGDEYNVPKYHFTRQAAYAFATRFYLFYQKYDKAIECANACLGSAPANLLRNYDEMQANYGNITDASIAYVSSDVKSNLLLQTNMSSMFAYFFRNYSGSYKRFGFNTKIAETEVFYAKSPWAPDGLTASGYRWRPRNYNSSNLHYTLLWKIPSLFEYIDPVAGNGYRQTIVASFTADEVLLERAEAYVLSGNYQAAVDDLNMWAKNFYVSPTVMTPASIREFYAGVPYYTWIDPTSKRHLNPAFEIDSEGSVQEAMIHAVLNAKRIENFAYGMRWLDIKRYGIKIYRRFSDANAYIDHISDSLDVNDLRRAIQVPQRARDAGLEPTKR